MGTHPNKTKRLNKNIKKAGRVVRRRQESINAAYYRIMRNKLMTILADEMQLVRLKFDNRHLEATGVGFPVVGPHDTNMAPG